MKKLLIISMLCLAACGQQMRSAGAGTTIVGVDPAFQPYIDLYIQAKGVGLYYSIPMGFSSQTGNIIGVCTRWSNGARQIEIDPVYWNDPFTTESERVSLIFHELGHCDLNRDHNNTLMSNGWPQSFMYPYNYGYISSMESHYFYELFNPTSSSVVTSSVASHHGCVHDIEGEPDTSTE